MHRPRLCGLVISAMYLAKDKASQLESRLRQVCSTHDLLARAAEVHPKPGQVVDSIEYEVPYWNGRMLLPVKNLPPINLHSQGQIILNTESTLDTHIFMLVALAESNAPILSDTVLFSHDRTSYPLRDLQQDCVTNHHGPTPSYFVGQVGTGNGSTDTSNCVDSEY
jgi:hypothetical protein